MTDIEADFEPLANVLPKDYGIFEPKVLGHTKGVEALPVSRAD